MFFLCVLCSMVSRERIVSYQVFLSVFHIIRQRNFVAPFLVGVFSNVHKLSPYFMMLFTKRNALCHVYITYYICTFQSYTSDFSKQALLCTQLSGTIKGLKITFIYLFSLETDHRSIVVHRITVVHRSTLVHRITVIHRITVVHSCS